MTGQHCASGSNSGFHGGLDGPVTRNLSLRYRQLPAMTSKHRAARAVRPGSGPRQRAQFSALSESDLYHPGLTGTLRDRV